MKKSKTILKILSVILTIVVIVMALSTLWLGVLTILQANDVPIPMTFEPSGISMAPDDLPPTADRKVRVVSVILLIPVSITGFFIFFLLRSIVRDMLQGIRFDMAHVKKMRIIALIIAFQGLWQYLHTVIYSIATQIHNIKIELFNEKYLWVLVVVALAEVFRHGVELQTDVDMTV